MGRYGAYIEILPFHSFPPILFPCLSMDFPQPTVSQQKVCPRVGPPWATGPLLQCLECTLHSILFRPWCLQSCFLHIFPQQLCLYGILPLYSFLWGAGCLHLCCWAWLCPMLEQAGTSCVWHGTVPAFPHRGQPWRPCCQKLSMDTQNRYKAYESILVHRLT